MLGVLGGYRSNRSLRSSGTGLLAVPRVNSKSGESAFSFYAALLLEYPMPPVGFAMYSDSF